MEDKGRKELEIKQTNQNKKEEMNQRVNLILSSISTICVVIGLIYTAYSINVNTKTSEFYSLC